MTCSFKDLSKLSPGAPGGPESPISPIPLSPFSPFTPGGPAYTVQLWVEYWALGFWLLFWKSKDNASPTLRANRSLSALPPYLSWAAWHPWRSCYSWVSIFAWGSGSARRRYHLHWHLHTWHVVGHSLWGDKWRFLTDKGHNGLLY